MSKDVLMCRRCQEHEESAWKAGGARNAQMIGASYVLSLPWKRMSKPPIPQALRVFDPQAYESGPRRVSSLVQNLSENLSCRLTDFQILKALPNAFSSIFGLYFALSLSVNSFLESQPIF